MRIAMINFADLFLFDPGCPENLLPVVLPDRNEGQWGVGPEEAKVLGEEGLQKVEGVVELDEGRDALEIGLVEPGDPLVGIHPDFIGLLLHSGQIGLGFLRIDMRLPFSGEPVEVAVRPFIGKPPFDVERDISLPVEDRRLPLYLIEEVGEGDHLRTRIDLAPDAGRLGRGIVDPHPLIVGAWNLNLRVRLDDRLHLLIDLPVGEEPLHIVEDHFKPCVPSIKDIVVVHLLLPDTDKVI